MIFFLFSIMYYAVVLMFGIAVSLRFCNVKFTKTNLILILGFAAAELVLQSLGYLHIGVEKTTMLYPLIVHVPLLIFMVTALKKPFSVSLVSILSAYLCCQIPRWLASAGFLFDRNYPFYNAVYLIAAVFTYLLISGYVARPMYQFMAASKKQCLLMGMVPFFYYVFDYATTVYTDMLFMGTKAAVQFMPSVVSVFYFCFVLVYYSEIKKQEQIRRDKDMLSAEIQQAHQEMRMLRSLQENEAVYRHDMKHHLVLLRAYAAEGNIHKINEYLSAVTDSLDRVTPKRFTRNETVNLILSAFETQAQKKGIVFRALASLPDTLPINDAEICSLLFNGLENAFHAVSRSNQDALKKVKIEMTVFRNKLLIEIENTCPFPPVFKNGLPQTDEDGHGFGTKSIQAIAENHGGQAIFDYLEEEKSFNLKIMVPLNLQK